MNFIAARSSPHRSIHHICAVYQKYTTTFSSLCRPNREGKIPRPPRRSGKIEARGKNGERGDLYNQSNIVDKSSARNPSAKINYGRLPGFGQRAIRIPHTRASSSPPLLARPSGRSPSPSSLAPALFIPHFNPPTPLLQNKFAAIFLFRGPHIYVYIYIYSALLLRRGACSTPRKRRREAAVVCSVGSAFWTTSGRPVRVCVCMGGWSGGWLHTWVDGGLNNEGEGGWLLGGMGGYSTGRFAGNFFSSEFSKGNDLRYISKGFLLVGKRVRRSAIHPPAGGLL